MEWGLEEIGILIETWCLTFHTYVGSPWLWLKSTNKKLWCWYLPAVPDLEAMGTVNEIYYPNSGCTDKWRENQRMNYHLFSTRHWLCTSRRSSSFSSHHSLEMAVLYHTVFSINCSIPNTWQNADHLVILSNIDYKGLVRKLNILHS